MGAKFSAPIQIGPGTHPASYTAGTDSLLGIKWTKHGINLPPSSGYSRAMPLLPCAFMAGYRGKFTYTTHRMNLILKEGCFSSTFVTTSDE